MIVEILTESTIAKEKEIEVNSEIVGVGKVLEPMLGKGRKEVSVRLDL